MREGPIGTFLADENGATVIEYGLIASLVALAIFASFVVFSDSLAELFGYGAGGAATVLAQQTNLMN
jgi:Flp pilus assembly pilin Flp